MSTSDVSSPRPIRQREETSAPKELHVGAASMAADGPRDRFFETTSAARVVGLPPARLRRWARTGFITPAERRGDRLGYSFRDLVALRAAKTLLNAGVPFSRVRESVRALTTAEPVIPRPLARFRFVADGQSVFVRDSSGDYDPVSKQQFLPFNTPSGGDVRELRVPISRHARCASAYAHYLEGCRLDADDDTLDRAESSYLEAIRVEPTLACAYTNLGNVRYRRGAIADALTLYRQAIALDPVQPEAHYNLGFLSFEEGDVGEACQHFRQAVALDDAFADAHFNLAMALTQLGSPAEARIHWEAYLALDPHGPWAEIARRHLHVPESVDPPQS